MERAPIPPHERLWRHPSELGPTQVDNGGGHHRAVLFASGTLAVVMVATFIVAMTPPRSTGPLAVSATTAPATPPDDDRSARISSFPAIPNAIAAVPNVSPGGRDQSAAVLPDLDDEVIVLTEHVAYAVPWRDVAWLSVDRATVVGADGAVVARFESGRLIVTADAVVGAALTVAED